MPKPNEIEHLIEPHFFEGLSDKNYDFGKGPASSFLTSNRFDLAFKLAYLALKENAPNFSKEVYASHIRALTLDSFKEPGNEDKDSVDKFISEFDLINYNMEVSGFDVSKSIIPISKNGTIVNGAHRVASAIFHGNDVSYINIETEDHIYDYRFFNKRNTPSYLCDLAATTFLEYANDVHVAFIWPIASSQNSVIDSLIPNVVYQKDVKFNLLGAHNLISQIYHGEEWLGTVNDNFKGAKGKLVECFRGEDTVKVIAFQAESLDRVLEIKEKIRKAFNVGKHSIHITDTQEESIRASQLVFNDNAIHFLNNSRPNRYLSAHSQLDSIESFFSLNKFSRDDFLFDSSLVLAIYGIREAQDIDYLTTSHADLIMPVSDIHDHESELEYYSKDKDMLIYDPGNYFFFNGIKFCSFNNVYLMKKQRGEKKDHLDCELMQSLLENDWMKRVKSKFLQSVNYKVIKLKQALLNLLRVLKLFDKVRAIYRFFKKR